MKRIIKEINTEPFYNVLLYTEGTHTISINEDDVDSLFENASSLSFLVAYGDSLRDALKGLDTKELDFDKATKAIFVVKCSKTYQMETSELSELGRYINENLPNADIRWGLATKNESEKNVTVVAATTF